MINRFITILSAVLILGSAAVAQLVFDPLLAGRDIAFPDTPIGQSNEIRFTATSRGNGPWTVRLNTNNQQFVAVPNQFVVQNGQAVAFVLRFTPQQAGVVNGLLSGSYDNGREARFNANLSGRGVQAGGPRIAADPDTLDLYIYTDELGTIWQSTEVAVTISNTGNAALNVQSITDNANWLVCDRNAAFAVAAGQSVDVTFSVPQQSIDALTPNIYQAVITINSNAGNQQHLAIPVYFERDFIPHYLVVLGDDEPATDHAILVASATIEGEELEEWDEVGVFNPRGDLAGSGPYELDWPIAFIAWGDDANAGFNGLRQNEAFDFRIWDASASHEYNAEAEFVGGPARFANNGVSEVHLTSAPDFVDQVIPLRAGWKNISLRVSPEERYWAGDAGPEVPAIFEPVRAHVNIVKNDRGQFYLPANNFNGIPYIDLERGLQVRMSTADTLIIRGTPIPEDEEITLTRGWNLVAYYPNRILTMAAAFEDLTRRNLLVIAKDDQGRFFLVSQNFGGNVAINPGSALMINIRENCTFHYPAQQLAGFSRPELTDDDSTFFFARPNATSDNMSILISGVDGIVVRDGAEIACRTPAGFIAGASRLKGPPPWGMAVWGDDSFTEAIDGFRNGESLSFSYYDGLHQWEWEVGFDVIEGGEAVYSANNLIVLGMHVGVEGDKPNLPMELSLKAPYPNPFNATSHYEFDLPQAGDVKLSLVDLNGREQLTIAKGRFDAGTHSSSVDASALPAGVYLAVLETGGRRLVQRAVLLK